jgi:hypothetical protein
MSEDEIRIMKEAVRAGVLVGVSKLSEPYPLPPQARNRLDGGTDRSEMISAMYEDDIGKIRKAARFEVPLEDSKVLEPVYELVTGPPKTAANGLENQMCIWSIRDRYFDRIAAEVDGIQDEVDELTANSADPEEISNVQEVKALLKYILFQPTSEKKYKNGVRDLGRVNMTLSDFMANPHVAKASLNKAELVAMRLYTTMAYIFMNGPLRDESRYRQGQPCPLPVTTYFATNGIKKLRASHLLDDGHVNAESKIFWRGMRNRKVADDFLTQGGTELAFMSTTSDLNVAVRYSISPNSLLFKIVPTSFMTMGADVQWLSAFPGEAEILYPPLTYLRPSGRKQVFDCYKGAYSHVYL